MMEAKGNLSALLGSGCQGYYANLDWFASFSPFFHRLLRSGEAVGIGTVHKDSSTSCSHSGVDELLMCLWRMVVWTGPQSKGTGDDWGWWWRRELKWCSQKHSVFSMLINLLSFQSFDSSLWHVWKVLWSLDKASYSNTSLRQDCQ